MTGSEQDNYWHSICFDRTGTFCSNRITL